MTEIPKKQTRKPKTVKNTVKGKVAPKANIFSSESLFNVAMYSLSCPITGEVKYIGKSTQPKRRFKEHLSERNSKIKPLYKWINEIKDRGSIPVMTIIAYSDSKNWEYVERLLISDYKSSGNIFNISDGGNQPFCPKEIRASNGLNTAKAIHSDAFKKHIWKLKRDAGEALKHGHFSQAAKEKLRIAARKCPELFGSFANV